MDPSTSNHTRPSNVERVQLPSIQNLVNTLPPNTTYRSPSNQSTWASPFHNSGPDPSASNNHQANHGPQRNRLQSSLPPALHTPPPRNRRADSPLTVTASPSVIISSASSGVSEHEHSTGDHVRPPRSSAPPLNPSVSSAPIRTTPQDPRSNSPVSSGLSTFAQGTYRSIRPSHSFVSQIPSIQHHQQPQQPRGANQDSSRLPAHLAGGRPPPTSTTTTMIDSRLNTALVPNREPSGHHHPQADQDPRRVPHPSDRQSGQPPRTFSPPHSSAFHQQQHQQQHQHDHSFITPSSERYLPPRNGSEYMHRQHVESLRDEHAHGHAHAREDHQYQPRSSETMGDDKNYPPPTPPWDSQGYPASYKVSSVRALDPGDVRARPTLYSRGSNESPVSVVPSVAYRSHRSRGEHSSYASASRESRTRDDRMDTSSSTTTSQAFSLRPARWAESDTFRAPDKGESRTSQGSDQSRQGGVISRGLAPDDEEHGILATRPADRRYPPILPAPPQSQRHYVGSADETRMRHAGSMTANTNTTSTPSIKPSRYGSDAAPGAGWDDARTFAPKQTGPPSHSVSFTPGHGSKPPLPSGLIRHKSKEDLERVLRELSNEATRAIAEGRAMKKIHEFSRTVQQFAAYNARFPGPPEPTAEEVEEMSHRAVLIYRMAQAVKARILAKKAAAANQGLGAAHSPGKKKPITKEEKQVLEDMERIRRKRTSAQQGIKSKYMKRNKKTVAPKQCASCNTKETPEWRKGPDGPRSLCNACGLHWAKLQRKRKEDGQWVGQGAPPPIDIITLRQVTGVGLQPRFNERGELEIPGTYSNIPASRAVLSSLRIDKSPPATNVQASNVTGPSGTSAQLPVPIPPTLQSSEGNDVAMESLVVEDQAVPPPSSPLSQRLPSPIVPDAPEGRAKKRKASRDHGASNTDDEERAAPSTKRRRAASPRQGDNTQPPTSAEETIWQRAF